MNLFEGDAPALTSAQEADRTLTEPAPGFGTLTGPLADHPPLSPRVDLSRFTALAVFDEALMETPHAHAWRVMLRQRCADRCGLKALLGSYPFYPYLLERDAVPDMPVGLVAITPLAHPDAAVYGACRHCGRGVRFAVPFRALAMQDTWVRLGCTHCEFAGRIEARPGAA